MTRWLRLVNTRPLSSSGKWLDRSSWLRKPVLLNRPKKARVQMAPRSAAKTMRAREHAENFGENRREVPLSH